MCAIVAGGYLMACVGRVSEVFFTTSERCILSFRGIMTTCEELVILRQVLYTCVHKNRH